MCAFVVLDIMLYIFFGRERASTIAVLAHTTQICNSLVLMIFHLLQYSKNNMYVVMTLCLLKTVSLI